MTTSDERLMAAVVSEFREEADLYRMSPEDLVEDVVKRTLWHVKQRLFLLSRPFPLDDDVHAWADAVDEAAGRVLKGNGTE